MFSFLRPLQGPAKKLIAAGIMLAVSLPAGWAQKAQDSWRYTARLASPVSPPRDVAAAGFLWSCKGNECFAKSSVPNPTVGACAALAAKAGRIISFGNDVKSLGPGALAQCAKRALVVKLPAPPGSVPPTQSKTLLYRARLALPVSSPRDVATAGFLWSCKGSECFAKSPNPSPTVAACSALAAKAGRIVAFGNEAKSLGAAALAQCAKRALVVKLPTVSEAAPTQSKTLRYRARLARPVSSPRDVAAAGFLWSCKGNECFAKSSILNPTVAACAALGAKAGRIISFGNVVKSLEPAALAQCAKRVVIAQRNAPLPGAELLPGQDLDVGKIPGILPKPLVPPIAGKKPLPEKPKPPSKPAGGKPGPPPPLPSELPVEDERSPGPSASELPVEEEEPSGAEPSREPAEPGVIDTATLILRGSDEPPRLAAPSLAVTIPTGALRIEGEAVRATFRPLTIETTGFTLIGE